MRFLSMFSGIDAASVAWGPLGWKAAAFCEIEAFPSAVLAHHYPDTPNLGDVTKADFDAIGPIDLAVFGSPCQSFSVAGLRLGLDDARGNLALIAGRIVYRKRPRWFVFENVPGLLSSDGGSDFGTLLAAFAGYPSGSVFQPPADGWGNAGVVVQANGDSYGLAWRVLDAQYFGVAQRRRRVFVVGYLGEWRRAAAVLFERHSLSGHPAPRREAGKAAPTIPSRSSAGGGLGTDFDCDGGLIPEGHCRETAPTLNAAFGSKLGLDNQHIDSGAGMFVAHTLKGEGFDASEDGTGRGTPIVPVSFQGRGSNIDLGQDVTGTLGLNCDRASGGAPCIAFSAKDHGTDAMSDCSPTLRAGGHSKSHANAGVMPAVAFALRGREGGAMPEIEGDGDRIGALRAASGGSSRDYVAASAVRRLTPRECERLQGFPDDYTLIPYRKGMAADGPRYKALGNSMAVPVMTHIGRRIQAVEAIFNPTPANDTQPKESAA